MKTVFKLALALAAAPAAVAAVLVASPSMAQAAGEYWDAKLTVGTDPYEIKGADLTGKDVKLPDFKGKVVLIDFWATWCGPCKAEIPSVKESYKKYHDQGFEIVSVSLDRDKTKLTDYIKEHEMPWQQIYDADLKDEANAKRFGVQGIPFVLLVGKDGKIAAVNPRGDKLEPALKEALAK